MQIINDNLKCKNDDIRYRATRLKEKFDNYKHLLEEYPKLNYEEEKKILYHAYDSYEEVMEPIKKLYRK